MTKKIQHEPQIDGPTIEQKDAEISRVRQENEQLRQQLQSSNTQLAHVKAQAFDLVMVQQEQTRALDDAKRIFEQIRELVGAKKGQHGSIDVQDVMTRITQKFAP